MLNTLLVIFNSVTTGMVETDALSFSAYNDIVVGSGSGPEADWFPVEFSPILWWLLNLINISSSSLVVKFVSGELVTSTASISWFDSPSGSSLEHNNNSCCYLQSSPNCIGIYQTHNQNTQWSHPRCHSTLQPSSDDDLSSDIMSHSSLTHNFVDYDYNNKDSWRILGQFGIDCVAMIFL